MTTGQYLFSLLPPAFAAVPQYFVHTIVVPLPLSEPDKRISHTSGSSVGHSLVIRSTKRVQVPLDAYVGPPGPRKRGLEPRPCIRPSLARAVEPFEKDLSRVSNVEVT